MVMSERSTVVGVFTEDLNAKLAADELRRVGFSDDEMSVSRHGDESGGFKASLKRMFKGQETTPVATANDFIRMGVPERDAHYYQSELEAGQTIVLVRVAGQEQEVLEILRKHGAMTSRSPNSDAQAQTDPTPVAPDMYDPIANRDAGDSMVIPEDQR
jgi:hypothetical protein